MKPRKTISVCVQIWIVAMRRQAWCNDEVDALLPRGCEFELWKQSICLWG